MLKYSEVALTLMAWKWTASAEEAQGDEKYDAHEARGGVLGSFLSTESDEEPIKGDISPVECFPVPEEPDRQDPHGRLCVPNVVEHAIHGDDVFYESGARLSVAGRDGHHPRMKAIDSLVELKRRQHEEIKDRMERHGVVHFGSMVDPGLLERIKKGTGECLLREGMRPESVCAVTTHDGITTACKTFIQYVAMRISKLLWHIHGERFRHVSSKIEFCPSGTSGNHHDYYPVKSHGDAVLGHGDRDDIGDTCHHCGETVCVPKPHFNVGLRSMLNLYNLACKVCNGNAKDVFHVYVALDDGVHGLPSSLTEDGQWTMPLGTAGTVTILNGKKWGLVVDKNQKEPSRVLRFLFGRSKEKKQ